MSAHKPTCCTAAGYYIVREGKDWLFERYVVKFCAWCSAALDAMDAGTPAEPSPFCPRDGCNGVLRPRLTRDGSGIEGEECHICGAKWMFDYPRPIAVEPVSPSGAGGDQ